MTDVLVVGCGFIGSHVALTLAERGEPPRVLTRSRPDETIVAAVGEERLLIGDAADRATVAAAMKGIERVAFCAGGLLPAASQRDPELDRRLTLGPLRTTLSALRGHPGVSFAYLSSGGTVYGDPERLPAREEDRPNPISAYGSLHFDCEREIEAERRGHRLRSTILRCSTVYGEQQRPGRGQGAVVTFLDRIERGEPIDLYGDGSTLRDYIYAGDAARAMIALLELEQPPPVVNVGAGHGTSLIELLRLIERQVGREAKIVQHGERDFEVHQIVLDTSVLQEVVDLPITPLEEGIALTHRWLKAWAAQSS
jgi:UDP-glucose 4-epimerase